MPLVEKVIELDVTPYEMMVIDEISQEYDISVFDIITFVEYFNELFIKRATVEHLQQAKKHFSESTKETLIGIYISLEMYEHCEVLK